MTHQKNKSNQNINLEFQKEKLQTERSFCPKCGEEFFCEMNLNQSESCWCFKYPKVAISENIDGCVCPKCLREIYLNEIKD